MAPPTSPGRESIREQIGPTTLTQQLDNVASAGDETTHPPAQRLPKRAGENVDPVDHVVQCGGSPALRPNESGCMAVIHHHQCVMPIGKFTYTRQVGDEPVHGEDAIGCDHHGVGTIGARLGQGTVQIRQVTGGISVRRGLAQPDPIDDRGMVERVRNDGVTLPQQGLEDSGVRIKTRREGDRSLGPEERRGPLFQLVVDVERPTDETHGCHAISVVVHRVGCCRYQRRMVGQPEVVVGAQVQNPFSSFHLDRPTLRGGDGAFGLVETGCSEPTDLRRDGFVKGGPTHAIQSIAPSWE